jgi:hypothetical protein
MKKVTNSGEIKLFPKGIWWTLFITATFLMSFWFKTFKIFTLNPNFLTTSGILLVTAFLILNILVLAYDSYVHEQSKGKIQKPVALFEWLNTKRSQKLFTGSNCKAQGTQRQKFSKLSDLASTAATQQMPLEKASQTFSKRFFAKLPYYSSKDASP